MDNQKKISIIIPFYNNKSTIKETLDSVINQTYTNTEIILVDDGSTEKIEEDIKPYLSEKNILYFRQNNKGVSFARNFGASISTGDYLVFLDADDLIEKTYLEKCIGEFNKNQNVKIVYSLAKIFGRDNKIWELGSFTNLKNFLIGNCIFVSAMIKKIDFENINGFDTKLDFYEDWDLWISILKDGGDVIQIQEYLFFYRTHANYSSASDKAAKSKNIHTKNRFKIYSKHYDLYEKLFTDFEDIFLTYIDYVNSIHQKPKKKRWYDFIKKVFPKN